MRAVIIVSLVVFVVQHVSGSPIYRPRGKSGGSRGTSSSRSSGRFGSSYSSGRSRFSSRFRDPAAYQAPSKTLSRITEFNSDNHPRARIRIPMSLSSPVRVMYSSAESLGGRYDERHSDQLNGTPGADSYLYRTMSWLGLANDTDQDVPYRRRYPEYFTTTTQAIPTPSFEEYIEKTLADLLQSTTPGVSNDNGSASAVTAVTHPTKMVDLCTLARWNRELQSAEVPNLFLTLIANDVVSGNSTADKERFTSQFFDNLLGAYAGYNSSWDTFRIPTDSDVVACNLQSVEMTFKQDVDPTDETSGNTEEPIHTSVRNMVTMYSNVSQVPDYLSDVVAAAKACLPGSDNPAWQYETVLPCLEFTLTPEQLTSVNDTDSLFGSSELCREHLNHDLLKCTRYHRGATCRLDHLVALNAFARNYYLCHAELEEAMVRKVRERVTFEREQYEDWMLAFAKTLNTTSITNDTILNTTTSYSLTTLIANVNPSNMTTGEL